MYTDNRAFTLTQNGIAFHFFCEYDWDPILDDIYKAHVCIYEGIDIPHFERPMYMVSGSILKSRRSRRRTLHHLAKRLCNAILRDYGVQLDARHIGRRWATYHFRGRKGYIYRHV